MTASMREGRYLVQKQYCGKGEEKSERGERRGKEEEAHRERVSRLLSRAPLEHRPDLGTRSVLISL